MLETLTIRPEPRLRIAGRNVPATASGPTRFTSNWRRTCSAGIASAGPRTAIPAALMMTSGPRPAVSALIRPAAAAIEPTSVTSSGTAWMPEFWLARASSGSRRRAAA